VKVIKESSNNERIENLFNYSGVIICDVKFKSLEEYITLHANDTVELLQQFSQSMSQNTNTSNQPTSSYKSAVPFNPSPPFSPTNHIVDDESLEEKRRDSSYVVDMNDKAPTVQQHLISFMTVMTQSICYEQGCFYNYN
jgi:hypothetical protein